MSTQEINVTVASTNIEVTVSNDEVINLTFPSTSTGQLTGADFGWMVSPVESPDRERTIFTIPNGDEYRSGCLTVFRDGVLLDTGVTEISSTQFQLASAPAADEKLLLLYLKQ